jgi:hypothetical protein
VNWQRPVAAVLVAATLTVGSVGVAPRAKADSGGESIAAVNWQETIEVIVAGWLFGKIADALVLKLRWSRWWYGIGCGTVTIAARSGVRGAIEQSSYSGAEAPDYLVNRAADNIVSRVGC